jgi:hypothetical protein
MNLRLDSPPFDLLYANIKARANSSASKPPSNPQRRPATHRLDVVDIFSSTSLPVDFIPGKEHFLVNFVLAVTAKDDQINPHQAAGSSSFHKVGISIDVLASRAFSTTEAS